LLATGRVSRINPLRLAGDRPLYGVYITLEATPAEVVAGMSSDAAVIIARREDVLQLPRAMVRSGPNSIGRVEVWRNGQREPREVKVGLRGDIYVEIIEGLAEGEEVVSR
jgi:multidrug efflux pump subunit AcrA (membrane-fusion protein)